ncbi:MAG: zinc-binding dehydrogenase [Caldilineaceae bacterium]|nr:zinc-binding dehydrogenase [Caldilineaceae bacterium]MCY4093035.1 zinc-binding dehydrogenase [Caldilineaceae bacterium]
MKIAILHGPRDLRIEEQALDASQLGGDEIHVKTRISALKIGTDRGNYEGADQVPGAPGYPRWVGDSNLGIVQAVGSGVKRVKVGDRVVTRAPHQSEYIMSDSDSVVVIPDGVADEDAVYAHLYALSAHCYHKAHFRPGETVAVVGVGVLGLGAIALGPLFGGRVAGIANSPVRMEMSERMGAHANFLHDDPELEAKLDAFSGGKGIDLVILTANPWPAFRTAMEIVRDNGRVSVVSLLGRGEPPLDFNPLAMELFYNKGTTLIAVSGRAGYLYPDASPNAFQTTDRYAWDNIADHVVSLMADGLLEPSRLVTHRFHYSEMVEAYEMAYHREKQMLGVIFNWQE